MSTETLDIIFSILFVVFILLCFLGIGALELSSEEDEAEPEKMEGDAVAGVLAWTACTDPEPEEDSWDNDDDSETDCGLDLF